MPYHDPSIDPHRPTATARSRDAGRRPRREHEGSVAPESLPQPVRAIAVALFDLIRVEQDLDDAYSAASERDECAAFAGPLRKFLAQHRAHLAALTEQLERLGAAPPMISESRRLALRGEIAVASMGGPTGILHALEDKENRLIRRYTRAASRPIRSASVERLLERGMASSRTRRDWLHVQR